MDQLADIYIPEESFWSNILQPGWLALAALIIICLFSIALLIQTAERRALRKRFTNYLRHHSQLNASQANAILKAYIRSLRQQTTTASLHGKQWRAFLLANCNLQGKMQELEQLSGDHYTKESSRNDNQQLSELAIYWIQRHKKTLIQP